MSKSQPLIPISRDQAFIFAGFLVLYEFLTYIANDMIMPGMIHVIDGFHAPESKIASSLTAYIIGGASLQIFLGPLSDRFGRRPVMLTGTVLFLFFTFMLGCSQSMDQFIIGRFFEGMGLCFISVIGYTTLQEIFSEMDAVRLIAILANISTIAPLLGPLLGATFILHFHWRGIFFIITAFTFIVLIGLWRYMPETVGVVKTNGTITQPLPLAPTTIISNYWQLIINPSFLFGSLSLGFLTVPCLAWIAISPIMLIADAHLSLITYGLWQIPVFGANILGNLVLRRLTYQYLLLQIILRGSMLVLTGLGLSIFLHFYLQQPYLAVIPGISLYALGLGITIGPLSRKVLFSTDIAKGTASALMMLIMMAIEAAGVEGINFVYKTHANGAFIFYCFFMGLAFSACLWACYAFSTKERGII